MIEIDVHKIFHNVQTIRKTIAPDVKLCCVVKGDGYGCGDVRLCRVLQQYCSVDMIAVAMLDEAMHLRDSGIVLPILVLCDIADEDAQKVIEYKLIPSIYRMEFLRRLNAIVPSDPVFVHVRLDVCAGSPGMLPDAFLSNLEEILAFPHIALAGLYTQLYGAYLQDKAEKEAQLEVFCNVLEHLPSGLWEKLLVHAASTATTIKDAHAHFDMVRVGAGLYGLPYEEKPSPFLPIMSIKSRIVSLKSVRGAAFTGYHPVREAQEPLRLATVLGGYEDALFLMFVQKGHMLVRGMYAPIVGEACMDTTTIDVTHIPDVALDDEVVLLGTQGAQEITIADIMRNSGFTMANCQLVYKTGRRTEKKYRNYPSNEAWRPLLAQVEQHNPTVRAALRMAKNWTLNQYIQHMAHFATEQPLCDPQDVSRAVQQQLSPILGKANAQAAADCATECLLTANHHGVDCFAQSVQGNLIYERLLQARGMKSQIIPVIACSGVPMDNSSYGKGLMLFDTLDGAYPLRVPVIPNKFNDSMVGLLPAFTQQMQAKAQADLDGARYAGKLSEAMRAATAHILSDLYGAPDILSLPTYVAQACGINYEMTRQAVGTGFAYVDLEQLAVQLLIKDFADANSPAALILQDAQLRRALFEALEGAVGCWKAQDLATGKKSGAGTMLFWAVGERYTRIPLLDADGALTNVRTGERIAYGDVPFALAQGRIYPALLMSFFPLLFERGLKCFGGCFQPAYLRVMQKGLSSAYDKAGYSSIARVFDARDTHGYLSGPMFLEGARGGSPMGIVEMLAHKRCVESVKNGINMDFLEVHRIALANLYTDIVPLEERVEDFARLLNK